MTSRIVFAAMLFLSCAFTSGTAAADTFTSHRIVAFRKAEASSILDVTRRRLVLVGGEGYYVPFPYVETLDLTDPHAAWQHPETPGARPGDNMRNAPAVYDRARDRMIVLAYGTAHFLSLESMTWTSAVPSGSAPELTGAQVILDPTRDRLVGLSPNGASTTTWTLNLAGSPAWAPLPFLGPVLPARTNAIAVYDQAADRMVVVGGKVAPGAVNDTWQLTFTGTPTWSQVAVTGTAPPPLFDASFGFDPATRSLYVCGGRKDESTFAGGTWRLALGNQTWSSLDISSQGGWNAASAWDSAGARLVVAGGEDNQTIRSGTFAFAGTWTQIPADPFVVTSASFAGYDPTHHRWVGLVGLSPAYLSMPDSSWSRASPYAPAGVSGYGRFYDPATNLLGVFDHEAISITHPGVDTAWVTTALSGPKPTFDTAGTIYLDAPNHRVFVFGGWAYRSSANTSNTWWTLDYLTSTWTVMAPSTPLGNRIASPFTDRRRNRMLVFGGAGRDYDGRYVETGDCWSLDLSTLVWRQIRGEGTPPTPRFSVAADYDSLRDRAIIHGGAKYGQALPGVYYLQFSAANDSGTWSGNDQLGASSFANMYGSVDPVLDRFFVPEVMYLSSFYELAWDPPLEANAIRVECPPPTVWSPGSTMALHYGITQEGMAPRNYAWTVSSQRAWPGFPLTGFQQLSDGATYDLVVNVPVPDTSVVGTDTLTFSITDGSVADSCRVAIGDQQTPALWVLLEALFSGGQAHVSWWTADRAHAAADIERREAGRTWQALGSAPISGDGMVRFDDATVSLGTRYAYRAGIEGAWSGEAWVDVPAGALAFARPGVVERGALIATFTLPSAGPARLEAFDLAGRRVAARDVSGAGLHTVELAPARTLRSGVYFLRLAQGAAWATARAVLLSGRN